MGIQPEEISTQVLLEQAGWLNALARRLVRDPAEADDVAQETMLAALSSDTPPERPWLARVARNVARMRARSRSARSTRESGHEPQQPPLSTADLVEKLEAQRLLVEAVRDLREPYRSTVLLHYWEHRTSEEIAQMHGVSAGTVRWRLKQGVDALREQLDARHGGDRRAWSVLLVPLSDPSPGGAIASTSLLTGILGMKLLLQGTVAVATIVLVGGGLWMLTRSDAVGAGPDISNERVPGAFKALEDPASPAVELDQPQESGRTAVELPSPSRTEVVDAESARIEARVLDEFDRPIAKARIVLAGELSPLTFVSDGLGRIAGSIPADSVRVKSDFRVSAHAHATRIVMARLERGRTTYLGDIVLQPGGSVSGVILDTEHRPVAGATVGLDEAEIPQSELRARSEHRYVEEPFTHSAADGTYRIDGAPASLCRVVAFSPAHEMSFSGIVEVRAGLESTDVDMELRALPPEQIVRGIVLDPDGNPVPRARIEYRFSTRWTTTSSSFDTDGEGRFQHIVPPGAKVDLYAHDPQARWSDAAASDLKSANGEIILRFGTARHVEIAVTDPDGKPIEEWEGLFLSADRSRTLMLIPGREHAGGITSVRLPALRFMLTVSAHGFAEVDLGPFDPDEVGDRLLVVMQSVPGISGRVIGPDGPVAGATVRLFREAEMRTEHNGFQVFVDPNPRDRVLSRKDGSFVLTPKEGGIAIVRAEKESFAPAERVLERVDPQRGVPGVELRLSAGGAIEGRVLPMPGREPAGTVVAVSRGDGFARTQRVGPDGAFSFEHLMPGRWNVTTRDEELDPLSTSTTYDSAKVPQMPWNCEVYEGRTTRFDLGTKTARPCVLNGRLSIRGAEAGTWHAAFVDEMSAPKPVPLDAAGGFQLERNLPGRAELVLTAISGPFEGTRLMAVLEVEVGEKLWSADVDAAQLALRGAGSGSSAPLVLVVMREDGSFFLRALPETGDVEIVIPAGKVRVLRLEEGSVPGPDPRGWTGGTELVIEAGAVVPVERP